MSEPIQAISQGNYILATQQAVSHDASLSGNGTVESPLGIIASALYDAGISNIIMTASLPAEPDATTLYLIPEE